MSEALFNCPEQTPTGSASPPAAGADPRDWCRSVKAQAEPPRANLPAVLREDGTKPLSDTAIWLLENARVELDYLYNFIKPLGYVLLLADPAGTIIGHRGARVETSRYRYWVSWFSDAPDAVKHAEARVAGLYCSGAPIIDDNDEVLGILCTTTPQTGASPYTHVMTGALAGTTARMIEERHFRDKYRHRWVIALRPPAELGPGALIAVDQNRRIVAADRFARRALAQLGYDAEVPTDLHDVFEGIREMVWRRRDGDVALHLTRARDGVVRDALITPPLPAVRAASGEAREFQTRPRIPSLIAGTLDHTPRRHMGGLPARVVARVRAHVDAHLGESIHLRDLAAEAGLSPYHFARAFKQAQGLTPLRFVLERRMAKARELLHSSALPISDIAQALGFSDQSHFTRRFREVEGVSPGQFRRQMKLSSKTAPIAARA